MEEFYVLAKDFSEEFENFHVMTTHKDIQECIQFFYEKKIKEQEETLGKIGSNLKKYNKEELTIHCEKNSKEWNDWSSDLILFYCCRFSLYKKPIPIHKK